MKLQISTDENGDMNCTFEGNPEKAVQVIATLMTKEPVLRAIIYSSVEVHTTCKDVLMDNIKSITVKSEEIKPKTKD